MLPLAATLGLALPTAQAQSEKSATNAAASTSATTSAAPAVNLDDPTIRKMTLKEAIAFAREHQPEVKVARARIEAAKAAAAIPKGQWKPQLGLVAQLLGGTANNTTASYLSDSALDIPRIGGTTSTTTGNFKPYASSFVGIGVGQEIFDFGRIAAQSVALEAFVDVERYRADAGRLDIALAVEEAFFAVQGAKAVVSAAEAAYDRARAHRDLAQAGVTNGLRPPIELARSEADLARFDVGRIRARGGLAYARAVFAAAVGTPDPQLDADTEAGPAITLPSLADAISQAGGRDPLIKEALAEVHAQEATTKAIGAEMRPNVFLSATLSGRAGGAPPSGGVGVPPGNGFLPVVPNWDVGVVFSWPLLDGVVDAREEASKAKEDTLRALVDLRRKEEVAAIQQAYFAVRVAQASLPALEKALDAARINYTQADARFKGGLATSVEVADAEALLTEAEIQLALGKFELARSRAIFGRTIAEER
jgi:outer membrane protein